MDNIKIQVGVEDEASSILETIAASFTTTVTSVDDLTASLNDLGGATSSEEVLARLEDASASAGESLGALSEIADRSGDSLAGVTDGASSASDSTSLLDSVSSSAGASLEYLGDSAGTAGTQVSDFNEEVDNSSRSLGDAADEANKFAEELDDTNDRVVSLNKSAQLGSGVLGALGAGAESLASKVGLAKIGVAGLTAALIQMASASADDAIDTARMELAIKNNTDVYGDYEAAVDRVITKGQARGFQDDALRDGMVRLTLITKDVTQAQNDLNLAEDVARLYNADLSTGVQIVQNVELGRIESLKRMGISIDANMTKEQALAALRQMSAGQADLYAASEANAFNTIRNNVGEFSEAVGSNLSTADASTKEHSASIMDVLSSMFNDQVVGWQSAGTRITAAAQDNFDELYRIAKENGDASQEFYHTLSGNSNRTVQELAADKGVMINDWQDLYGQYQAITHDAYDHTTDYMIDFLAKQKQGHAEEETAARQHAQNVLGYMKMSGESGQAGREAGEAFADELDAQLDLTAALAKADVAEIVAALNRALDAAGRLKELSDQAKDDLRESASFAQTQLSQWESTIASNQAIAQIDSDMEALSKAISEHGAEGGIQYIQGLVGELAALPVSTQAQMAPFIEFLQGVVSDLQQYGGDAGYGFSFNLLTGIQANESPIKALLGRYDDAFDRRSLYSQLGIDTGNNFGQGVKDRVAAWYAPIKAQLDIYLQAFEIVANTWHTTATELSPLGSLLPGVAMIAGAAAAGLDSVIANARGELAGLKADVDAQAASAISAHDAKGGSPGGSPGTGGDKDKGLTPEQLARQKEQANAELQSIADKHALADATDRVDAAQGRLNRDTAMATASLKIMSDEMDALKDRAAGAEQTAEQGVQGAQGAMDALRATHKAALDAMNEQVYQYNQQLLGVRESEDALIGPLQAAADAAAQALDDINDATAKQDRAYQHQKEALEDAALASEQAAKAIMGPLNAAYDAATSAVNAQQEAVSALSDKYANELFPITERLTALQNQQEADNRAKSIGDEAQTVGNLSARLANLTEGTAEYNSVQKELTEARRKLGQDEEIDSLTTKKEGIEAERDKALKAANDQLKVLQAQQKIAQQNRDSEQKLIDARKAALDERMAALQKEQELYDRQERDRAQAATEEKGKADADLKAEQDRAAAREKLLQDEIDKVRERETVYQHDAQIQEDAQQTLVDGAQKNADAVKAAYDQMQTDLTTRTSTIKDYLDSLKSVDDANVKSAQDDKDALQDSIQARKDAADLAKATSDYMAAYGTNVDTANQKLKDLTPTLEGVAPAMTGVRDSIKNDLLPQMNTLRTDVATPLGETAQTFLDYIGSETQTTDLTKNIPWAINGHNKEGFIARVIEYFDLGLGIDGLKGMTELRMNDWATDLTGILDTTKDGVKTSADGIAQSIFDGISDGLANVDRRNALAQAIVDAVAGAEGQAARGGTGSTTGAGGTGSSVLFPPPGLPPGYGSQAVAVGAYGGMGGMGAMYVSANVEVTLPNVRDTRQMSTNPDDYRGAAMAIEYAVARELRRRGVDLRPGQRARTGAGG